MDHLNRAHWLALAALCSVLAVFSEADATAGSGQATGQDVHAYRELVTRLASDEMEGRGPGTKGIDRARDLLVDQFKAAGLEPVVAVAEMDSNEEKKLSFTQPFGINLSRHAASADLALIRPRGEQPTVYRHGRDYAIMGFSASAAARGDAVWVGYGVRNPGRQYDSYTIDGKAAGNDALKGKVAVCYRFEPLDEDGDSAWARGERGWSRAATLNAKAQWAASHGAEALLFVNPPSHPKADMKTTERTVGPAASIPVIQISADMFHDLLQEAGRNPKQDPAKMQAAANAGGGDIQPLGVTIDLTAQLEPKRVTVSNVVACLPGAGTLKGEYIVIGAHYDHLGYGGPGSRTPASSDIHPGADDNASGTAGVVMAARRLAARAGQANAPTDRRSILFVCFAGEERGLLGSSHFVGHLDELGIKSSHIVGMINLDMIGRADDGRVTVGGVGTADAWERMLDVAAADADIKVQKRSSGLGGSDHLPFFRRGIPALFFFTGLHADYHTPRDTADKVDAASAMKVVAVVEGLARQLWNREAKLAFQRPAGSQRAFLGLQPGDQRGRGFVVGGVVPGGPAATAGLVAGDVITHMTGQPVNSTTDLLRQLSKHKPGQKVQLTVARGDEEHQIEVTLGSR